ncbi:hypothetical protein FACS189479_04920 [Spirochaetia bacterium]|nr:hypothetical protein FACS189479_04920 [Spirochaetia bacterium]
MREKTAGEVYELFCIGAADQHQRNEQGTKDALAGQGLTAADVAIMGPLFTDYCTRYKVDVSSPILQDYYAGTEKGIREKNEAAASDRIKAVIETYLGTGQTPADRKTLIDGIGKEHEGTKKDLISTWAEFEKECIAYDPEADFRPAIFANLPFPSGTLSYVGARAKVGKTTAMINIAREALTDNHRRISKNEKSRKVFFITLEMSRKQLLVKLVLSLVYSYGVGTPQAGLLQTRGSKERKEATGGNPSKDYYNILKGRELEKGIYTPGNDAFIIAVNRARRELAAAYGKTLFVYDGRGEEFPDIINAIANYAGPDSIVLLDYIQRMPAAENDGFNNAYMRVKLISDGVLKAANRNGCIIISGSQFNREVKLNIDKQEMIYLDSFRESGDIEQDGHNLIGLGRTAVPGGRYLKLLAAREENVENDCYEMDIAPAYSFMALTKTDGKYKKIEVSDIPLKAGQSISNPKTPEEKEAEKTEKKIREMKDAIEKEKDSAKLNAGKVASLETQLQEAEAKGDAKLCKELDAKLKTAISAGKNIATNIQIREDKLAAAEAGATMGNGAGEALTPSERLERSFGGRK